MGTYTRTIGTISSHYTPTPGTSYDATLTFKLKAVYTQNATNNTTSNTLTVEVTSTDTRVPFKVTSWSITGTGGTNSGSESGFRGDDRTLGTATKTISHGLDGTGSFTAGASVTVVYYTGTGTSTVSKTISIGNSKYTMPTINVYSTIAFSSTSPTMNTSVTMTITKASCATSGVRIQAIYDGTTAAVYEGTGTSTTWTVPNLATTTTSSAVKAITISIQSKKGSTYYAAKTYTLNAGVPASYVPSVSIGTVSDNMPNITPFIIDYSVLTIPLTGSVSSDAGASIISYAIEVRETDSSGTVLYSASTANTGASQSYTMTAPITTAATYIKATITDSRGRTATATTTISAITYTKPTITVTAARCDSDKTLNPLGAYVKLDVTVSIMQIGAENNFAQPIRVYTSSDGKNYSNYATRNVAAGTYTASYEFRPALAVNTPGWFLVEMADTVTYDVTPDYRIAKAISVTKASLPMALYDDGTDVGMTVGQIATGSGFNCYLDAQFSLDGLTLPGTLADYVIEAGTSSGWTYRKWASGKVEAWIKDYQLSNLAPSTWVSPINYKDTTITIPSGLFSSAPMIQATSTDNQWGIFSANATSSTNINVRFITAATATSAPEVNVYAVST